MAERGFFSRLYDRHPYWIISITWIVRLCIGALFIFSGIVKGIDAWGSIYKFREYFGAMGFAVWDGLNLSGVFLLCLIEFLTGFFLMFGCFRKASPFIAALIMAFMLPLTLWLAIANPIADCGCFGDAIKLSNWGTFWKNVGISVGVVWLLIYNRKLICLITPYLQWISAVVAGAYFLTIAFIGYYYQPLVDFRQYKIGSTLIDEEDTEEYSEDEFIAFVYEKDGVKKEFSANDTLPDEEDGWHFVERIYLDPIADGEEMPQVPKKEVSEKTIRFFTEDGREDVTDEVIGTGRQLILMIPVISEVPAADTWKINALYQWSINNDVEMIATVGGNPAQIRDWKDISLAEYPIYTSDDTAIEEVARGNPAVVFLNDGVIEWKSSLRALQVEDFDGKNEKIELNPPISDNGRVLRNLSWIFLGCVAVLIILSFFAEGIAYAWRKRKEKIKNRLLKEKKNEK